LTAKLKPIRLQEKNKIEAFLKKANPPLGVYSFAYIYIWKDFFKFYYAVIKDALCVFAQDEGGVFLYFAPLGEKIDKDIIDECFRIMARFNKNECLSRIENITDRDREIYLNAGYKSYPTFKTYIYERSELTALKGNKFKHKRASVNFFQKHYKSSYIRYSKEHFQACLNLYRVWSKERLLKYRDGNPDEHPDVHRGSIYGAMLEQSFFAFRAALCDYQKLGLEIRAVLIDNKLKACSIGYVLKKNTFCIIFEVADLKIKGLAQFIFMRFCQELSEYKYIDAMDDSGLENLSVTKLSYKPIKIEQAFNIVR